MKDVINMNKAVIYARVSSKEQESEGYSIPAQTKLLKDHAERNGLAIVGEFIDVETAKKAGRTQFNNMLKFIAEHKTVKNILVEKTDRLLRNIPDYATIERLIEYSDIRVHLVKENGILSRDSRSNEKFMFGIKALMSKNHIDNLSEETKKGMLEKAEQGTYPSVAPYGYVNGEEKGRRVIALDVEAARFIKRAFELYAYEVESLAKLRKKLVAEGMIYRNGKNFHISTLERILKNEFYIGSFYWKGKKYENASHEPIVSKELFYNVQDKLMKPTKNKSNKGMFPYTNLIKCGNCGCYLTAEIKKDKYIYYHCTEKKGTCKQPYIKQEVVEAEFEKLLDSIQVTEEQQKMILQSLKESFQDKIEFHNETIESIEKQIKTLQNRIDQAYLDKLDGKISEEFWKQHTSTWMTEKEQLSMKLLATQKADTSFLENANLILELAKKASGLFKARNAEQKRKLINLVTSNCIYKDGKLDLKLAKPFEMIMESSKSGKWLPEQDSNLRQND